MIKPSVSPSGSITVIYNNEPVTGTYSNGTFTFKKYYKAVYQMSATTGTLYPINTRYLTAKFCEVSSLRSNICLKDLTNYFPRISSVQDTFVQFVGDTTVAVSTNQISNSQPLTFIKYTQRIPLWPIRLHYIPTLTPGTITKYEDALYGECDTDMTNEQCVADYSASN
jgi:hypothetical protein